MKGEKMPPCTRAPSKRVRAVHRGWPDQMSPRHSNQGSRWYLCKEPPSFPSRTAAEGWMSCSDGCEVQKQTAQVMFCWRDGWVDELLGDSQSKPHRLCFTGEKKTKARTVPAFTTHSECSVKLCGEGCWWLVPWRWIDGRTSQGGVVKKFNFLN